MKPMGGPTWKYWPASGPVLKSRLMARFQSPRRGRRVLATVLALPLLPAERIEEGAEAIMTTLLDDDDMPLNALPFLQRYLLGYWLRTVGTNTMSVADQDRRTTNDAEAFHSAMNSVFRPVHPNAWCSPVRMLPL